MFFYRLGMSARGRLHRAGLLRRRGDNYLGCGRRRYCGWDQLSEPQASSVPAAMGLAGSRSPSSFPRRSPGPARCNLPLASVSHLQTNKKQNPTPRLMISISISTHAQKRRHHQAAPSKKSSPDSLPLPYRIKQLILHSHNLLDWHTLKHRHLHPGSDPPEGINSQNKKRNQHHQPDHIPLHRIRRNM